MQSRILRRTRLVSALASLALAGSMNPCYGAELPVKRIVLYKHGVGFFEREGIVPAGEEARLNFQTADMNDVLKSLTVTDASGNRISAIRYDSNETLDQRLAHYPFRPGNERPFHSFLDGLKGARIELKIGERLTRGAILGARGLAPPSDPEKRPAIEQVSLLLDSGELATYDLAAITSIRLLDPHLEEQLRQYLQTVGQSKAREQRRIFIDFAQAGAHNLRIAYISPTAIWKSSYRLTLEQPNSILEGWAIVDNTTDEDWNDVNLSVVSGRPISFVSLLDTPRFGQRAVAELPADRAAGPVVIRRQRGRGITGTFRRTPRRRQRRWEWHRRTNPSNEERHCRLHRGCCRRCRRGSGASQRICETRAELGPRRYWSHPRRVIRIPFRRASHGEKE
jgi:hypothetical protein